MTTRPTKTQIVCPKCLAPNRVGTDKPARMAKCGKCKTPLFPGTPTELSERSFEKFIQKTSVPVVVDFWAPWCGPCKMMGPEFAKAATMLEPQIRFVKLNTQDNQNTAARYGISGIPSLILFKQGRQIAHQAGVMPAGQIKSWLLSHI